MKSEINMMNLLNNHREPGKTSPGPKAGSAVEAHSMNSDCAPVKEGTSRTGGEAGTHAQPAFKKIMKSVAAANKNAVAKQSGESCIQPKKRVDTGAVQERKNQSATQAQSKEDEMTFDALAYEYILAASEAQAPGSTEGLAGEATEAAVATDASELFKQAIETISQKLNLKIDQGLETVQIDHPAAAAKDLIAEMLVALKGIVALLEDAVKNNQPIEMGSTMLDAPQAAHLGTALRSEVFHIEIALSMVKSGQDVAALVAQKSDQSVDTGLIQAMDPSSISMPASHLKQVLNGDLVADGQKVESLFAKLSHLLREQMASGNKEAVAPGIEKPFGKLEAIVTDIQAPNAGKKAIDVGEFGTQVMRTLLKIDKVDTENKDAALQNEKFDLPKIAGALFAKKPGELAGTQNEKLGVLVQGVIAGKDGSSGFIDHIKSQSMPKTVEESVMNQLAGKMHEALKTGITEIRLLLRPESLGEMRVKLTIDGDVVMGKIYVENQQVKHIIETNMQSLKDSLAQHNLQTGSFDVNVGGHGREQLDDLATNHFSHQGTKDDSIVTSEVIQEPNTDLTIGGETGRRFGANTIEYFA
jgi:flagellar hook-length control protein FliK